MRFNRTTEQLSLEVISAFHLVQPPAQSRPASVSHCPGPFPVELWVPPGTGIPPPLWSLAWPPSTEEFFFFNLAGVSLAASGPPLPPPLSLPPLGGVCSIFSLTTHEESEDSNYALRPAFSLLLLRLSRPSRPTVSLNVPCPTTLGPLACLALVCQWLPCTGEPWTGHSTPDVASPLLNRGGNVTCLYPVYSSSLWPSFPIVLSHYV